MSLTSGNIYVSPRRTVLKFGGIDNSNEKERSYYRITSKHAHFMCPRLLLALVAYTKMLIGTIKHIVVKIYTTLRYKLIG